MAPKSDYLRTMSIFRNITVCFAIICSAQVNAETEELSETDKAALQLALSRGVDLYHRDQAAWHVTDAIREDIKDLSNSGIGGWLVTEENSGWLVTFWRQDGDTYSGVYSAIWRPEGVSKRTILQGDQRKLSADQIKQINIKKTVTGVGLKRCTEHPFNTAVLPPASEEDSFQLYLLTPQTSKDAIPMGLHYRFSLKNGSAIDQRQFTNSCIDLSLKDEKSVGVPEALFITHILDDVPTELHVFSALSARIPLYVGTVNNDGVWKIEIIEGKPLISLVNKK